MSYFYNISENVQLRKQDDKVVNVPEKNYSIHQQHTLCDYRMRETVSSICKALNYLMCKRKHPPAFFFFWITLFILVLKV